MNFELKKFVRIITVDSTAIKAVEDKSTQTTNRTVEERKDEERSIVIIGFLRKSLERGGLVR